MGNVPTKETQGSAVDKPGPKTNNHTSSGTSSRRSSATSKGKHVVSSSSKTSKPRAGSDSPSTSSSAKVKPETTGSKSPDTNSSSGPLSLEEMVDGGYLHTHGIYSGPEDFKQKIVRQLMIERRLSPFFKGLADIDENWSDRQLMAAVRNMPIPDEPEKVAREHVEHVEPVVQSISVAAVDKAPQLSPDQESSRNSVEPQATTPELPPLSSSLPNSSITDFPQFPPAHPSPSSSDSHRTASTNSDDDSVASTVSTAATSPDDDDLLRQVLILKGSVAHIEDSSSLAASSISTTTTIATSTTITTTQKHPIPARARSKTASQIVSGPSSQSALPEKPIDVLLYRGAIECPICFLYYPKYINHTRCCAQPICSECFVQIKRPDPHHPHHEEEDASSVVAESSKSKDDDELLVSEPAQCPYCNAPDFGVIYFPPPFKSGVCSAGASSSSAALRRHTKNLLFGKSSGTDLHTIVINASTAVDVPTTALPSEVAKRRGSVPPTAPEVITADLIRPDWAVKLSTARHNIARKSAAASALHATAFLLPSSSSSSLLLEVTSSSKNDKKKNRFRGFSVGSSGNSSVTPSPASSTHRGVSGTSSRRFSSVNTREMRTSRAVAREVEEMMMMEAVRLSLYDAPKTETRALAN